MSRLGRSVSGVRVSVTSSTSEPYKDSPGQQNSAKQNEPQKNNRVSEDLQNPNFEEAITSIVDQNGGIHLNDGPGSLFSFAAADDGDGDDEVSVFVKPINTEVKQNIRRGLPNNNQIVVINRTQLALTESNPRANSRYQQNNQQPIQRQPPQQQPHYVTIQHNVNNPYNQRENRSLKASNWSQPANLPPQHSQRPQSRTPRQRIHIIVNNRTQVQEIPIDDPIDFQRIPAIHQTSSSVNRYSNNRNELRRPVPIATPPPTIRPTTTTTPVPRRETTERQSQRQTQSERRQIDRSNVRTVSPIQRDYDIKPEVVSVRRETIPQRPPPIYRTPEPFSTAVACNQKACRLPDCQCAGSDIPGIEFGRNSYH